MTHCCVIGGAGFIGIPLVAQLLAEHKQVTVIDKANIAPNKMFTGSCRLLQRNYEDTDSLRKLLIDVDEIIFLAYASVPNAGYGDLLQDFIANLPAAIKLFALASELPIKKFVFVSSGGAIYGNPQVIPIPEDHPTNPLSPYGITKLTLEKLGLIFQTLHHLPLIIIRPGNAYGIGQRPFTGQGFIATAIASILQGKEISLFGESGTIRDYIYVSDIAKGITALLERGKVGTCYNMGTGIGRSNKDILSLLSPLAASSGLEIKVKIQPARPYDVSTNVLDCRKIYDEVGWKPMILFTDGLQKTWEWFCKTNS